MHIVKWKVQGISTNFKLQAINIFFFTDVTNYKHRNIKYEWKIKNFHTQERLKKVAWERIRGHLQRKLWDWKEKLGITGSDWKWEKPFEASCEMAWYSRAERRDKSMGDERGKRTQTLHFQHKLSASCTHICSSAAGLSALAINALITKNEAVGRKSRIKCTEILM